MRSAPPYPADLLARSKVGEGDVPHVLETSGGLLLTPHDPFSPRQMEAARRVMAQRRAVLRQLAK